MSSKSDELKEIKKKLDEISNKLDHLARVCFITSKTYQPYVRKFVPETLSSLPKHLRKTALAVVKLGWATAEQVAARTGRARAAESDYLNQLVRQGILKKEKKGREVRFSVFALYTLCPQCGANVVITLDNCPMCGAGLHKN